MSDINSDTDEYEHWLETGEYPDGAKRFQFVLSVNEIDGILEDEPHFDCYGYNGLPLSTQSESDTQQMPP